MKILVCIKAVPDLETAVFPDLPPETPGNLIKDGVAFRMNRYDEYAVEMALQLRTNAIATRIDVLSVGDQGEAILRRAMGMGADHGVLIQRGDDLLPSPFTIAGGIAAYAQNKAYDLILCGVMSEDQMQGLVGPILARLLKRPCLTSVHAMTCSESATEMICERDIEGGKREILETRLPALVTIQTGTLKPRYPSLSKLLRANGYPLEVLSGSKIMEGDRRQVVKTIKPMKRTRQGAMLEGSAQDKASQLAALLHSRGLL